MSAQLTTFATTCAHSDPTLCYTQDNPLSSPNARNPPPRMSFGNGLSSKTSPLLQARHHEFSATWDHLPACPCKSMSNLNRLNEDDPQFKAVR